jgi:hypothetical protein
MGASDNKAPGVRAGAGPVSARRRVKRTAGAGLTPAPPATQSRGPTERATRTQTKIKYRHKHTRNCSRPLVRRSPSGLGNLSRSVATSRVQNHLFKGLGRSQAVRFRERSPGMMGKLGKHFLLSHFQARSAASSAAPDATPTSLQVGHEPRRPAGRSFGTRGADSERQTFAAVAIRRAASSLASWISAKR